jgi:hypothetical protein
VPKTSSCGELGEFGVELRILKQFYILVGDEHHDKYISKANSSTVAQNKKKTVE